MKAKNKIPIPALLILLAMFLTVCAPACAKSEDQKTDTPTAEKAVDDTLSPVIHENNNIINISNTKPMTIDNVRGLAAKGDSLLFEDFQQYKGLNFSSSLLGYLMVYGVEDGYRLIVDSDGTGIDRADLESIWESGGSGIDIRYSDVDEFIKTNPSHPAVTVEEAQTIAHNHLGRAVTYLDVDWWERDDEFPHHSKDPAKQALFESLETIAETTYQFINDGTFIAVGKKYGTIYVYNNGTWEAFSQDVFEVQEWYDAYILSKSGSNTILPQIMHNGVIYYYVNGQFDIEVSQTFDAPTIKSTVSPTQVPREDGQANFEPGDFGGAGAVYVEYGHGLLVYWNDTWAWFVTLELLTLSETEIPQYEAGTVTVITNGREYEPYEHCYFIESLTARGMVSTESLPLSLEDASSVLPTIQYTDDFKITITGRYATTIAYSLYDNNFDIIYGGETDFTPPAKTGVYMLCVYVIWSNNGIGQQYREAKGLQYVFKISIQ